jgi:hypothetical protein
MSSILLERLRNLIREYYTPNKVYTVAYNQLIAVTKSFPGTFARFIVMKNGKIYVANGHEMIHIDMVSHKIGGGKLSDEVWNVFLNEISAMGVINTNEKYYAILNYEWAGTTADLSGKALKIADFLEKNGLKRETKYRW